MTEAYLVRHGEAGERRQWHQPDEVRPLNDQGRRQAGGLVALLSGAGIECLLSSPFVRCVETLDPLAKARGLPVATSSVLAEGAGGAGAVQLLSAGDGVVACSHGDVIEEALDLLAAAGVALEGRSGETPKGATWVLDVAGGAITAGRLLPPPD